MVCSLKLMYQTFFMNELHTVPCIIDCWDCVTTPNDEDDMSQRKQIHPRYISIYGKTILVFAGCGQVMGASFNELSKNIYD